MANHLLFVFEGINPETGIIKSLNRFYLNENTVVHCTFCQDIYFLYDLISNDEDLDLFVLLKEKPENKVTLNDFNRDDFAEIYLFFDYDGHATQADDEKISSLMELFNNETELGKLYISYPMVEAYKHLHPDVSFETVTVQAKQNIQYKNLVHNHCHNEYKQNTSSLTSELWDKIIYEHLKKMNFIVYDILGLPESIISQQIVFEHQKIKYIVPNNTVAVLSAFPPMLLDYYGTEQLYTRLANE